MPITEALKIVAPHDLKEVLSSLKGLKLIKGYRIRASFVTIQSDTQERFELCSVLSEQSQTPPNRTRLKKSIGETDPIITKP